MSAPTPFPGPVLLADIGGTNVRFAFADAPARIVAAETRRFASLAEAVRGCVPERRPRALVACAAGPVHGRACALTNAGWRIEGRETAAALGLEQGLLLNDFEAQALSLPAWAQEGRDDWTLKIGAGSADPAGLRLVLGPGTGLGVAALIRAGGLWTPLASEAAHAGFGPEGPEEQALWRRIAEREGRVTAETIISGPGLARLHDARTGESLAASDIAAMAAADPDSPQAATVRLFWRLAARLAGDLAATFMATGGVVLSGGVLPRLAFALDPAGMRKAFAGAGPLRAFLDNLDLRLVTRRDAVFAGLAALAEKPGDYGLDWDQRLWR